MPYRLALFGSVILALVSAFSALTAVHLGSAVLWHTAVLPPLNAPVVLLPAMLACTGGSCACLALVLPDYSRAVFLWRVVLVTMLPVALFFIWISAGPRML